MQTDPIGYAGGMNLYAYLGNDPVNRVDPAGLDDAPLSTDIIVTRTRIYLGFGLNIFESLANDFNYKSHIGGDPEKRALRKATRLSGRQNNCGPSNGISVSISGSSASISGTLSIENPQGYIYIAAINRQWNASGAGFNITTNISAGNQSSAGIKVSYGLLMNQNTLGRNQMNVSNLSGLSQIQVGIELFKAAHEFGHILGLGNRYNPNGTPWPGHENDIMADFMNKPDISTFNQLRSNCGQRSP